MMNDAVEKWERKVKRLEKELARRQPGGANWRKTLAKLNVARARLENARLFAGAPDSSNA
jgi:transposase